MSASEKKVHTEKYDRNETEEDHLASIVFHLKEWLNKQEHLPRNTNDKFLYHIAAAAKGDCMHACKRLDTYYTTRTLIPEFFLHRDPTGEDIKRSAKCLTSCFLPSITTSDGGRIFLVAWLDTDPVLFDLVAYLRRLYMLLDVYCLKGELNPGQGVYFLVDVKGVTVGHVMKVSPSVLRKAAFCTQDVYPVKVKGVIFINVNDFIRMTITSLVMPLFREKLRKRFYMYGYKYDKLYNLIPRDLLPLEFGGNGQSIHEISDISVQDLIAERTWFLTEGSDSSDETKRTGKCPVNLPGCSVM